MRQTTTASDSDHWGSTQKTCSCLRCGMRQPSVLGGRGRVYSTQEPSCSDYKHWSILIHIDPSPFRSGSKMPYSAASKTRSNASHIFALFSRLFTVFGRGFGLFHFEFSWLSIAFNRFEWIPIFCTHVLPGTAALWDWGLWVADAAGEGSVTFDSHPHSANGNCRERRPGRVGWSIKDWRNSLPTVLDVLGTFRLSYSMELPISVRGDLGDWQHGTKRSSACQSFTRGFVWKAMSSSPLKLHLYQCSNLFKHWVTYRWTFKLSHCPPCGNFKSRWCQSRSFMIVIACFHALCDIYILLYIQVV